MRIGESLVRDGAISSEQLASALAAQRRNGGPLGTNLLELGFVEETRLGRALAETLRVRHATPEVIERIDGESARRFPRWLNLKYRAVPMRIEQRTLHVLVSDPRSLSGLSARTGMRIVPWVAPRVRVAETMQRLLGVCPSERDARALEKLRDPAPAEAAPPSDDEELARRLCGVTDGRQAIEVALDAAAERLDHVVLFRVREGVAGVWGGRGTGFDATALAHVKLPVASGSLLELLSVHPSYAGPVPAELACRVFFRQLDLPVPREMLLAPVRVGKRLVGILYGDAGPAGSVREHRDVLLPLARKLGYALMLVAVRHKIVA